MSVKLSITGGIVSVEDGIKAKEEFAPARKARVELHFDVPEGADHDAHVGGVVEVAKAHLHRILHGKATEATAHVAAATGAAAAKPAEPAKPETAAARKKREAAEAAAAAKPAEKTKADLEAEMLASLGAKPAAQSDDELLEEGAAAPAAKPAAEEDDLNDLLGDSKPVVITDKELGDAVQKKNAERKQADPNWAPAKIRDIISKFSGGKRVNDIPADKRADFLKEIEAVK